MSIVAADPDRASPETGSQPVPETVAIYGRVLGGEAHRTRVPLQGQSPPEVLDIPVPGPSRVARYRLLHAPRTRRPVTDDHGDYLYLPQRHRPTRLDPR